MPSEEDGDSAGEDSVHLSEGGKRQAAASMPVGPLVIHEVIREQGLAELRRSFSGLTVSGLAAGMSMSFSFLLQSVLQAGLPDTPWRHLVAALGYTMGFLIVVLGQQQLFTETTLTAVLPALTQRTLSKLGQMLRVWGLVLAANLVGTALLGTLLAQPGILPPDLVHAMDELSVLAFPTSFGRGVLLAAFAGWLIGLMTWLLPASGAAKPLIIILLTYVIAAAHFPHVIAGSVEASYAVVSGHKSVAEYFGSFLLPVLVGNVLGGTLLAALLNHAPVAGELDGAGENED